MPDLYARRDDGDPLVDLADVCDANEILMVQAENQRRSHQSARDRARRKR